MRSPGPSTWASNGTAPGVWHRSFARIVTHANWDDGDPPLDDPSGRDVPDRALEERANVGYAASGRAAIETGVMPRVGRFVELPRRVEIELPDAARVSDARVGSAGVLFASGNRHPAALALFLAFFFELFEFFFLGLPALARLEVFPRVTPMSGRRRALNLELDGWRALVGPFATSGQRSVLGFSDERLRLPIAWVKEPRTAFEHLRRGGPHRHAGLLQAGSRAKCELAGSPGGTRRQRAKAPEGNDHEQRTAHGHTKTSPDVSKPLCRHACPPPTPLGLPGTALQGTRQLRSRRGKA